jgi:hypothetical protein
MTDMEEDMRNNSTILELVQDDQFATSLYSAMCNVYWENDGVEWGVSWRTAGGIVAELRNKGEDYIDFYCSGGEGQVSDKVRDVLESIGWKVKKQHEKYTL